VKRESGKKCRSRAAEARKHQSPEGGGEGKKRVQGHGLWGWGGGGGGRGSRLAKGSKSYLRRRKSGLKGGAQVLHRLRWLRIEGIQEKSRREERAFLARENVKTARGKKKKKAGC